MIDTILKATAVAGTLDILAAMILTTVYGRPIPAMLRYVASGPFPSATGWGTGGALLGLAVHFALMAVMAATFVTAARGMPMLVHNPIPSGVAYGLITYVVMNLIVVPLRFPAAWPPKPVGVATQLFCHIVLVGIPIALIVARGLRGRTF